MPDATPPTPPAPAAPPAAPAPAKSSVLPKILVGCLGVVVLLGILLSAGAWWFLHKVRQYADNPAALAALVTARDPNLEVVSQDDARKTVTIRNKRTGEVLTFDASQLKQGKFEFTNGKGEKVTIGGAEAGKGVMKVETKEGTTTLGDSGEASIPGWVPSYPGAKPQGAYTTTGEKGAAGAFSFQTADAVAKVLARYEAGLQGGGFKIEKTTPEGGAMGVVAAKHADGREVNVTALRNGEATAVNVQYQEKK